MEKIDILEKAYIKEIDSVETLKEVLLTAIEVWDGDIQRLAYSMSADDNFQRIKFLGNKEFAIELLARLRTD